MAVVGQDRRLLLLRWQDVSSSVTEWKRRSSQMLSIVGQPRWSKVTGTTHYCPRYWSDAFVQPRSICSSFGLCHQGRLS